MITAQEARKITESSQAAVEKQVTVLSNAIEVAAASGKWVLYPADIDKIYDVAIDPYYPPNFNDPQRRIRQRLIDFGFHVEIETYKQRVGGGLGSMDDEVTEQKAYRIRISW
jgi:hypothetical protein